LRWALNKRAPPFVPTNAQEVGARLGVDEYHGFATGENVLRERGANQPAPVASVVVVALSSLGSKFPASFRPAF